MSASLAPSGYPSIAIRVWSDNHNIYAELPSTNKTIPPYILSFSRDLAGQTKLLSLILSTREASGLPQPSRRKLQVGTPLQSASAEALLRRKGIIK